MKKKKSILFINNIFESAGCSALEKVAKLLHGYERIVLQPQARPSRAMREIKRACREHSPSLVVAHSAAAALAMQLAGIERVIIEPYFSTGNMMNNILRGKMWTNFPLLSYGTKGKHIRVTDKCAAEFNELEEKAFNGDNSITHGAFFSDSIDTVGYKEYVKNFGTALSIPGKSLYGKAEQQQTAKFIKGLLEC